MEIKNFNLSENINTILNKKYVVPLYQRNFAWKDEEISQLLQDIYESFKINQSGNYYIGSLVVIKRKNGDYEVIDGQQRLTAIILISKVLNSDVKKPELFYDSRPEVETFLNSFFQTGQTNDVTFDYKVSHLINAVDFIKNAKLNSDDSVNITIENLDTDFEEFKTFFLTRVVLVFVELPAETDVAAYFEIMNNRGQQLQKHEILKARLLDKIKKNDDSHDTDKQKIYSKIWDICSQMNVHVQKLFDTNDRKILFGENYDELPDNDKIKKLLLHYASGDTGQQNNAKSFSINEILLNPEKFKNAGKKKSGDTEDEGNDEGDNKSILDFPNFLMHIFKLKYQTAQNEIQLNEKYLLDTYNLIESIVNPEEFITDLLYYRSIFDKYIIKATTDENSEDKYEWTLQSPYKYYYEAKKQYSLRYNSTFTKPEEQKRIIKCLSMLQVSFRTRIYKNWLQEVLTWFIPDEKNDISGIDYRKKLDDLALSYYKFENEIDNSQIPYAKGTATHHFIFNFIDYLYWVACQSEYNINKKDEEKISMLDCVSEFDFNYRNSVEHHLPQSFENINYEKELINNLGNLCLVSKSANSKMNNESPIGKADKKGKYYNDKLPPKRKIMYDFTNNRNKWGEAEIKQHYNDVILLLKQRNDILK